MHGCRKHAADHIHIELSKLDFHVKINCTLLILLVLLVNVESTLQCHTYRSNLWRIKTGNWL